MGQWALSKLGVTRARQAIECFDFHLTSRKRLAALFVISVILTLWGADSSVTAELLFQSPQSPVDVEQAAEPPPAEPPPAEQPPVEQPPAEQATAEPPPAEEPPAEPPPAEQPPVEQPPVEQEVPVEPSPAEDPPAEVASPEPALVDEPANEAVIPEEPPAESVRVERGRRDETRLESQEDISDQSMIMDRIEFVDTIVVSGAYIWLCCGVIAFLLVPVFMLILYVRGRSKIVGEEEY